MQLQQLITNLLEENDSKCLDDTDDREFLIKELTTSIEYELSSRIESTKQFIHNEPEKLINSITLRGLVKDGYSTPEIAERMGVCKNRIKGFMARHQIQSQTYIAKHYRKKKEEREHEQGNR